MKLVSMADLHQDIYPKIILITADQMVSMVFDVAITSSEVGAPGKGQCLYETELVVNLGKMSMQRTAIIEPYANYLKSEEG